MSADITYEHQGSILNVRCGVSNGWRRLKNTFGYWDSARAPFRGDITLKTQVEITAVPHERGATCRDFPSDLQSQFGEGLIQCGLRSGVLNVRFFICNELPWRLAKSRDPEVFWEAYPLGSIGTASLALRFWAIFVLPDTLRAREIREWDTQFCSGGLPSLGKRR